MGGRGVAVVAGSTEHEALHDLCSTYRAKITITTSRFVDTLSEMPL